MPNVDLQDVEVFVMVVEAGGFSAAGRARHLPKSSVSRQVSRLEAAVGTRLLHRTTRSLALTDAGRVYYERAARALAELRNATTAVMTLDATPRGRLRMSAPPDVGSEVLPPLIVSFVNRFPDVQIEIDFTNEPATLVAGGYDLALRTGTRSDDSLTAVTLQEAAFRLYAAPAYLDRFGSPAHPRELANHQCVLFRAAGGRASWHLVAGAESVDVTVTGPISANDMTFVRRAAIAGAGIALLPEIVGERTARSGQLTRVSSEFSAEGIPLFLEYPSATLVPPHVRVFRDFLLASFPQIGG